MIEKLVGREKVVWSSIANKVNEIIEVLNNEEIKQQQNNKEEVSNE